MLTKSDLALVSITLPNLFYSDIGLGDKIFFKTAYTGSIWCLTQGLTLEPTVTFEPFLSVFCTNIST